MGVAGVGAQQELRQGQGWRAELAPCPSLELLSQGLQGQALQGRGIPAHIALRDQHRHQPAPAPRVPTQGRGANRLELGQLERGLMVI